MKQEFETLPAYQLTLATGQTIIIDEISWTEPQKSGNWIHNVNVLEECHDFIACGTMEVYTLSDEADINLDQVVMAQKTIVTFYEPQ